MEHSQIDILDDIHFHTDVAEEGAKVIFEENIAPSENSEEIHSTENIHEAFLIVPVDAQMNTASSPLSEKKKQNGVLKGGMFIFKYILSSTLIFFVLLVATNYSAYYNVIQSYVNSQALDKQSQGIISSVAASNIKENVGNDAQMSGTQDEKTNKDIEYSIDKLLSLSSKKDLNLGIDITPYDNRIIIPAIGKNIPLIDVQNQTIKGQKELNNIFMKELENGVIRYPGSAVPGNDGNTFIFGHSSNFHWIKGDYNDVFALLNNVKYDDEVIVYYNQEKYTYKIREKRVIKPGDVSVLKTKKNKSELSLMTCWPIGTTLNRLIVKGELISVE